jgi:hypothetical protein
MGARDGCFRGKASSSSEIYAMYEVRTELRGTNYEVRFLETRFSLTFNGSIRQSNAIYCGLQTTASSRCSIGTRSS